MSWTHLWSGKVGGRDVSLERYEEGDLRAHTVTAQDEEGYEVRVEKDFAVMPPKLQGSPITIEPLNGEPFRDALMQQGGFSAAEADEIMSHAQ